MLSTPHIASLMQQPLTTGDAIGSKPFHSECKRIDASNHDSVHELTCSLLLIAKIGYIFGWSCEHATCLHDDESIKIHHVITATAYDSLRMHSKFYILDSGLSSLKFDQNWIISQSWNEVQDMFSIFLKSMSKFERTTFSRENSIMQPLSIRKKHCIKKHICDEIIERKTYHGYSQLFSHNI